MSEASNVMRRTKRSENKTPVSCPNVIKSYNNGIGGVDIMNQNQLLTDSIVKASIALT